MKQLRALWDLLRELLGAFADECERAFLTSEEIYEETTDRYAMHVPSGEDKKSAVAPEEDPIYYDDPKI